MISQLLKLGLIVDLINPCYDTHSVTCDPEVHIVEASAFSARAFVIQLPCTNMVIRVMSSAPSKQKDYPCRSSRTARSQEEVTTHLRFSLARYLVLNHRVNAATPVFHARALFVASCRHPVDQHCSEPHCPYCLPSLRPRSETLHS
jgi:hypothetical protein